MIRCLDDADALLPKGTNYECCEGRKHKFRQIIRHVLPQISVCSLDLDVYRPVLSTCPLVTVSGRFSTVHGTPMGFSADVLSNILSVSMFSDKTHATAIKITGSDFSPSLVHPQVCACVCMLMVDSLEKPRNGQYGVHGFLRQQHTRQQQHCARPSHELCAS
jgi:hypothetical protein